MLLALETTTDLIKLLKHKDPVVRAKAIQNIGSLGPDGQFAILNLSERLKDVDATVRARAAFALGQIGSGAVEVLILALKSPDVKVRREAVWAFGKIGPEARSAIPALGNALADSDGKVRKGAARTLGLFGREAKSIIPQLIEAMKNSDYLFCRLVAWALGKIGAPAVPALMRALVHPDMYVRRDAAWALGQIGGEARAAIPLLTALLNGIEASSSIPGAKIGPMAKDQDTDILLLDSAPCQDSSLRACAAEALGLIGVNVQSAISALTIAVADSNSKVSAAAAKTLREIQKLSMDSMELQIA